MLQRSLLISIPEHYRVITREFAENNIIGQNLHKSPSTKFEGACQCSPMSKINGDTQHCSYLSTGAWVLVLLSQHTQDPCLKQLGVSQFHHTGVAHCC